MQHLFWKLKQLPTGVEKIPHSMSNVACTRNWKLRPLERKLQRKFLLISRLCYHIKALIYMYNNNVTIFHISHKNSPEKNPPMLWYLFPFRYFSREENLLTVFRLLLARIVLLFEECKSFFRVQMLENKMKIG